MAACRMANISLRGEDNMNIRLGGLIDNDPEYLIYHLQAVVHMSEKDPTSSDKDFEK